MWSIWLNQNPQYYENLFAQSLPEKIVIKRIRYRDYQE
ncbi:2-hydroxyacid dehydrogenase domain protein [Escherichia coli 2-177-06_S4_C1]|nr:2-hydroxyacid dehydrogenase domain protein [Escherichia coli 2-177-06_S4_C1]